MAFDPRLPAPTPDEREHSERLAALIRTEIAPLGAVDFSRFMQLALYAPGLGYYSAGKTKFGAAGDFTTAPELGPVFAQCVARAIAPVLRETAGDLLELGAGSGAFAVDVLLELQRLDAGPARYRILETSADLRARQAARIATLDADLARRVEWLDQPPPNAWRGVLFANEVVDALPVRLFSLRSEALFSRGVAAASDGTFQWQESTSDAELSRAVERALDANREHLPLPYRSEVLPQLGAWFQSVAGSLERGLAMFIDYGYPRREYYLPQRREGTLVCHYQHRAHADPLILPGLQDITAFVDFTALAEAGCAAGFELACYATQARFLIACGLQEIIEHAATLDDLTRVKLLQQVRRLTLPGEMGERFKMMAFARGIEPQALPLAAVDESFRL